jgi:hypothetical protein
MKSFDNLLLYLCAITIGALCALLLYMILATSPAGATHDTIYSPCSTEYGFIHMTYDEWTAHITTMEADGTIEPGVVFRYWEADHTTGKGTNVQEDGTIPAWDQWARGLTDGQILSIRDWTNGDYPEIEALMFSSGLIPEWILDANMTVRRFNDPYWAQANPLTPTFTVWQSLCMGDYGYSLPAMEINSAGVWESNIPPTTTTVVPSITTTTTTTAAPPASTTSTTTTTVAPATTAAPAATTTQVILSAPPDGYDLFDAEWDGYPFEQTVLLLEERYPPRTPGKFHFRLSVGVEFLRKGGMVKGLDNLWESGE